MDTTAKLAFRFDDGNLRRLIRKLVEEKGQPVQFLERWNGELEPSYYGWQDFEASEHIHPYKEEGCRWVIAEQAVLMEKTYGQFDGSDAPGIDEVGINIHPVACACGQYTDMTLRYTGSLGDILRYLLGNDGIDI